MTLPVREFRAEGFRSLKAIAYPMAGLDVFVGANGVGKTNLYRALELLQAAAANRLAGDLVRDGGLRQALWAGARRRNEPAQIRFAVGLGDPSGRQSGGGAYRYEVTVGLPPPTSASFGVEPDIKEESVSYVGGSRPLRLMERKGRSIMARDEEGRPAKVDLDILDSETVLGRLEEPSRYPELDAVRRTLLQWRFYHGLRTDPDSPLRRPCPAIATPTLASDGSDLAAVFATLVHIRQDASELNEAVEQAFPGARPDGAPGRSDRPRGQAHPAVAGDALHPPGRRGGRRRRRQGAHRGQDRRRDADRGAEAVGRVRGRRGRLRARREVPPPRHKPLFAGRPVDMGYNIRETLADARRSTEGTFGRHCREPGGARRPSLRA